MWRVKSWRWFAARVRQLLLHDTPIGRYFAPHDDEKPEAPRE